ncbi:MAG TPA: DUF805 domain-containing protein [Terracidiphilus sp.]|nr:DUF805 domain-containing protein [Terracidiphilus sp.]
MGWFIQAWMRATEFSGRSRRKEYWMFTLFNGILLIALEIILVLSAPSAGPGLLKIFIYTYLFVSMIPSLSVTVRRLHDVGKSGWWYFISLIPLIGAIYLFILMCTDSDAGWNEFGQCPK